MLSLSLSLSLSLVFPPSLALPPPHSLSPSPSLSLSVGSYEWRISGRRTWRIYGWEGRTTWRTALPVPSAFPRCVCMRACRTADAYKLMHTWQLMHTRQPTHRGASMYVCMYVCMHVHIHPYIYIYIYMYIFDKPTTDVSTYFFGTSSVKQNKKKGWLTDININQVGSCVLLAVVHKGTLFVANAGDRYNHYST